MIEYNERDYPNLYNEILKDYHFRFGKFDPIPYPIKAQFNHEKQQQFNRK